MKTGWSLVLPWIAALVLAPVHAAPPPELPGTDITRDYASQIVQKDSTSRVAPPASPQSTTWLEQAMRTWEAPTLTNQIEEEMTNIPLGKGAVFVPRFATASREPDLEILDSAGHVLRTGKTGIRFSLMPGKYTVHLGSGSHTQRISRTVDVEEGTTTPVIPDWSGLLVEVVDENNIPFRGEYEIARIDNFDAYGRGTGRDPELGEDPRVWVLRPGIYKIFGVGESYNTPTNFVTVRLLPGEFIRFTLVQNNQQEMKIIGGGVIYSDVTRKIASNWKFGGDIGGSLLFTNTNDIKNDTVTSSTRIELLTSSRLNYRKGPFEWDTRLWLNEGVSFRGFDISRIASDPDEVRLSSVHTWRFIPWLGPYGRVEGETRLFPIYEPAPEGSAAHTFVVVRPDSSIAFLRHGRDPYLLRPSFSPFRFQTGFGANVNIISHRYVEAKLLAGFGYTQETRSNEAEVVDSNALRFTTQEYLDIVAANASRTYLREYEGALTRPEFGPEAVLNVVIRLAHLAAMETEMKFFAPVDRYSRDDFRPDIHWWTRLSWRLLRQVTLDYQYDYRLRWPESEIARVNTSNHRISVRFSYSSR